ncbi:MAG: acetylornithine deacetylase [Bacteroidetes bacterium]|nr:MAG: acetylornithine deacetylase [Bacteroidota bacterium]
MIKNYFNAIRNFWKNKTFSALNILGLAIGMACAGLIFLWAEDEFSFDHMYPKKDRLYTVLNNQNIDGTVFSNWSSPRMMASSIKKEIPGIANACRISDASVNALFSSGEHSVYSLGRFADSSFFTMFTLQFTDGSAENAFTQLYSIVLTEKAAKKILGTEKNIIGKAVRMNNNQDYIVSGVLRDIPQNSSLQFEWIAPYQVTEPPSWVSYGPTTYVELDPRADLAVVNNQLYNYIPQKDASQKSHSFLFPMRDWHLRNEFVNGRQTGGGQIDHVRMLSVIGWIILFIACINFMNLSTARSEKRAKEVGVRKVLGSDKKRLIAQFLVEALCMSVLAGILAVVMILMALPAFNQIVQKQLTFALTPIHILALATIILICGLVAGSYPSLYLSSFKPIAVLKGLKIKTGSAAFIRKSLVVIQFTVSLIFIISTIIILLQIRHVKERKLGFNKNRLIEMNMQHDIAGNFSSIKNDLLGTGLVENAAMAGHEMIYGGDTDNGFTWNGKTGDNNVSIPFRKVSSEFMSTYGMHLIHGRDFDPGGVIDHSNIIITKSMEKLMGEDNAVGKIMQSPRDLQHGQLENVTVIGVVDDFVFGNVYNNPGPAIFFCRPPEYENLVYVRVKSAANLQSALAKIEDVLKKDNPGFPLQFKFVDEQFNQLFLNELMMSKISGVFAVLSIIISCLGLFGLAAYMAEQRIKEIGIRKVLGATASNLTVLLSKDFIRLVIISCVLSFPIAKWMMHRWLQNYTYRIEASWWIFASAGLIAILIAITTVSFQTLKAALANPVNVLKSE